MKRILTILAVVVAALISLEASASGEKAPTVKVLEKIPVELVKSAAVVTALETYYGKLIKMKEVSNMPSFSSMGNILSKNQIELKGGEVVYPEEIEFAWKLKAQDVAALSRVIRAPHTPD